MYKKRQKNYFSAKISKIIETKYFFQKKLEQFSK